MTEIRDDIAMPGITGADPEDEQLFRASVTASLHAIRIQLEDLSTEVAAIRSGTTEASREGAAR